MNSNEDIIDGIIGEIRMVAFGFAPPGWLPCDGRLLAVSQYMALYTVIGNTFADEPLKPGEHPQAAVFRLPNFQGRMPIGSLVNINNIKNKDEYELRPVGGVGGQASGTLDDLNLPEHNHECKSLEIFGNFSFTPEATMDMGNTTNPAGAVWSKMVDSSGTEIANYNDSTTNHIGMRPIAGNLDVIASGKTTNTGNNLPFPIMNPYLALNFIICVNGIYPMRAD